MRFEQKLRGILKKVGKKLVEGGQVENPVRPLGGRMKRKVAGNQMNMQTVKSQNQSPANVAGRMFAPIAGGRRVRAAEIDLIFGGFGLNGGGR